MADIFDQIHAQDLQQQAAAQQQALEQPPPQPSQVRDSSVPQWLQTGANIAHLLGGALTAPARAAQPAAQARGGGDIFDQIHAANQRDPFTNLVGQVGSAEYSASAGMAHLLGNTFHILDHIASASPDAWFRPQDQSTIYKKIGDWAYQREQDMKQNAAVTSGGLDDPLSEIYRTGAGILFNMPAVAGAIATGGTIGGMAGLSALESADQGPWEAAKAAAEGAASGLFMHVIGPGGRLLRMTLNTGLNYLQQIHAGVPPEQALVRAGTIGAVSALEPKQMGAGELIRNVPRQLVSALPETIQQRIPQRVTVKGPLVRPLSPQEQANEDWLAKQGLTTPLPMRTSSPAALDVYASTARGLGGGRLAEAQQGLKQQLIDVGKRELSKIQFQPTTPEEAGAAIREKLASNLEQTRSDLASEISPTPSSPEAAGSKVIEIGKTAIENFDKQADQAYKAAWQAEKDPRNIEQVQTGIDDKGNPTIQKMALPIDMQDVQDALRPFAERYAYTLKETDMRASLGLKAMRNIIDGPRFKEASTAELDLSMLKEASRTESGMAQLRDPSQGLAAASVAELQKAIDAKMANAAYPGWDPSSGTPSPALTNLQAGRKATAQKWDIADTFQGHFGKRNPEELEPVGVYRGLTWGGDAGIQRLRDIQRIAPDAMPHIGRAFIDSGGDMDALGPSTKNILFHGDPGLIQNLEEYSARQKQFGPLTEMAPEDLANKLLASRGKAVTLLRSVQQEAPQQMPGLFRSYIQGIFDRATREGDLQKVQGTLDAFLDMPDESKRLLSGDPAMVDSLNHLFFAMKRMSRNPNISGSGFMMNILRQKGDIFKGLGMALGGLGGYAQGGALEGGVLGGVGRVAGIGAEIAANKGLARLLMNQTFVRALTHGIEMDLRGDTAGGALMAKTVAAMASQAPPEPPEGPGTPPGGPPANPPEAPAGKGGAAPSGTLNYGVQEPRSAVAGGPGGELPASSEGVTQRRPAGNPELQQVTNAYNAKQGLPPADHSQYHPLDEAFGRRVADAYDALKDDNSDDPKVRAAYVALMRETKDQYDHLIENGYTLEPWTKEGQPYANSHEMAADLRDNKHLYFYTGGEPHPFLSAVDPDTGLSYNDMFRAVHDAYGHAAAGYGFGPRGEEGAHDIHSQSFSPLAREAMTTETRGQNSWVNFGRQNYDAEGNPLNIPAAEKPFAKQKVDLLPDEAQTPASERNAAAKTLSADDPFRISDLLSRPDQVANAALERMRQRGTFRGATSSGLGGLSDEDIADLSKWAGARLVQAAQKIYKGATDFAGWSKEMIEDFGEAVKPHLQSIWDMAKPMADTAMKDVKRRTMQDLDVRIPDEVRVVSKDPTRTVDGKNFHMLDLDKPGPGFLPMRRNGEEAANKQIMQAWQESIEESEGGGGTTAADAVKATGARPPDAKFWDEALSKPDRSRYWYELSGESFTGKHMDLPKELQAPFIDVVASTSGGAEPPDNLRRAIGVFAEDLQKVPVMTDLRDPVSPRKALDPSTTAIESRKYGSFSGTMQRTSGLATKNPLPTNDVQVGSMFDITGNDIGKNPILYEVLSRFFIKLRDLQNRELLPSGQWTPKGPQPYESYQLQAQGWVHERARKDPAKFAEYDDYSMAFPDIIRKLQAAGIPTPNGKVTLDTLMDPRTPNAMATTREHFMGTPVATVEVASKLAPAGAVAAKTYADLQAMDPEIPWVRDAKDEYERIQRAAMESLGERHAIKDPVTGKKIGDAPSLISQLMSAITGQKLDVSRIDTTGYGTYKGEVNPNFRIPLTGRASTGWRNLSPGERDAFLSMLGQDLKQDAMAASHFRAVPQGQEETYSVFLNRYDGIVDHPAIERFSDMIDFPVNVSQHPNGTVIEINIGDKSRLPTFKQIQDAVDETWGNDPNVSEDIPIVPNAYWGDLVDKSKYQEKIDGYEAAQKQKSPGESGRVGRAGATYRDPAYLARVREEVRAVSRDLDFAFGKWDQEARFKIQKGVAKKAQFRQPWYAY